MANSGSKDDNGSQFFFTLNSCPELQNKHTIFGKVTGNTIYNMIKLEDCDVDQNERPLFPHKIISTEILLNPFTDIVPRTLNKKIEPKAEEKTKVKGSKNFSLLSFGDEAEEEEEEVILATKEFRGKSKSSHDLLKNDPKLSSVPAVDESELNNSCEENDSNDSDHESNKKKDRLDRIKEKLKKDKSSTDEKADKEEEDFYEDDRQKKLKCQQQKL